MKHLFGVFLIIICTNSAKAQKISGYVQDTRQQPVPGATVLLQQVKDSSVVKIHSSDTNGRYSFEPAFPGNYFVSISFTGFSTGVSTSFYLGKNDVIVPTIAIEKKSARLEEVVINGRRPVIEVSGGKIVFNVNGSINATGTDAMELLRKSPGVVVDKDDNIIMNGKNGVTIYIDGRLSPLTGEALSNYLRALSSSSIDAIEIMTNPPAKYDAAGNGGIINIRLIKNTLIGTNISVNAGYSVGVHPKYIGGFSLNHRNGHINIFGNYNYNNATYDGKLRIQRSLADTAFDQYSITTSREKGHLFKAGMDYFINKNNTIGFILNGNIDDKDILLYSTTPIIYKPTNQTDRWLVADNRNLIGNHNFNGNINYRFTSKNGNELNMDADLGKYRIRANQMQPNFYFDSSFRNVIAQRIYQMLAPSDISICSFKADYEQDFKKGRLGAGAKFSFVNSDNDFTQYNVISNTKYIDSSRSNYFNYKENINAVYLNYSRQYKKVMVQLGVRMENSNVSGNSTGYKYIGSQWLVSDSSFKRNYTNVFPNVSVTFNKNLNHLFDFSYNRRIDRPVYQDLNPFEVKIDEYSYYKGNTELRPQYSDNFSITHSFKQTLHTKLSYSHVKDVFTRLADTTEVVKSFLIRKNAATQKIIGLDVSYNFQKAWYSCFINLNGFSSHYLADFGEGKKVDLSVNAFTANLQQTFNIGKGWSAELNGFYNSPAIWSGTFRTDNLYAIESGLQKKFLSDKAVLRVAVSDIFNSTKWHGVSDYAGQHFDVRFKWESQLFKASFSYRFGNTQLKAARQRKTSSDEEGKRVSSGGGGLQN